MSSVIPNLTECRLGSVCRIVGSDMNHFNLTQFGVASSEHSESCAPYGASSDRSTVSNNLSTSSTCLSSACVAVTENDGLPNGRRSRKLGKSKSVGRCLFRASRSKSVESGPQSRPRSAVSASSTSSDGADNGTASEQQEPPVDRQSVGLSDDSGWDPGSAGLLRLFESCFFNMDLALQYMYKAKDDRTRKYLVNRLHDFSDSEVDFYLLQLVSLYQMSSELAKVLYPYFIHRCSASAEFAIHVVWLLDTFDPLKRDIMRSTSSALSRPSSVPTFSQSAGTSYLAANGSLNDNVTGCAPNESGSLERVDGLESSQQPTPNASDFESFTLQSLRSVLFPTQETSLMLLARASAVPKQAGHYCSTGPQKPPGSHRHSASDVASARPRPRQLPCSSTLPNVAESSSFMLKHKRTVSDIITPQIANCPSKSFGLSSSLRSGSRKSTTEDRWLSVDSAVELFTGSGLPDSTTVTNGTVSDPGLTKVGSVLERHMPQSTIALKSSHPGTGLHNVSSLQRLRSVESADQPIRNQSTTSLELTNLQITTAEPNTSGTPPDDSGLRFTIQESGRSTSTKHSLVHQTDSLPDDPVLRLQLHLLPRLVPEWDFVDSLLRLGRRLTSISSKEQRTACLQAELANLNLHLPARVWLPVHKTGHIVLRIPPTAAVCLNSKDKAPYLIYLEVLACDDRWSVPVPCRSSSRPLFRQPPRKSPNLIATSSSSYASFSNCPWNSRTPSSTSPVIQADSVSLLSTGSGRSTDEQLPGSRPPSPCSPSATTTPETRDPSRLIDRSNLPTYAVGDKTPRYIAAGDIRNRLLQQADHQQPHRSFKSDPEDPSAAVLKEPWQLKCQRIQDLSPWGNLPGWHLTAAIVKVGDDLRQEQLAYQLLSLFQRIWKAEYVSLWLRPLTVIVTSSDSGLIEPVPDTVSLHQIRRHARLSLLDYYLREYGPVTSEAFLTAQRNFVESCAAYCLVSYLLQVKDRHNGNILLDNEGHVIHIDYGFMLSASPGKNLGFEMSPFKLTAEQVAVMGGVGSDMFEYFKCLILRGLLVARKHMDEICILVEISRATCPQLPCFARSGGSAAIAGLRQRFQLARTEDQLRILVDRMVETSLHSVTTRLYDSFQYYTNGIQ